MDEQEQRALRKVVHKITEPYISAKVLKVGDLVKSARQPQSPQFPNFIVSGAQFSADGVWVLGDELFEISLYFVGLIIAFTAEYRAAIVLIDERVYWMAAISLAKAV